MTSQPNHQSNLSFSGLHQIAWDSTSMGALKTCPQLYFYTIVQGWAPRAESVHLTFGLIFHAAIERYDHALAEGQSHEDATLIALAYTLETTWNKALGRPWLSDDKYKNRWTLVRTVVWYLDQFQNDPLETIILTNGRPAVELSARAQIGYVTAEGQPYLLCGHLDRLATLQGDTFIVDKKTSKSTLTPSFFEKFSPDNQFSTYATLARIAYATPVKGLIVDAAQVAIDFSRFGRQLIPRPEEVLDEWLVDLGWWLRQAEDFAKAGYWPKNDKSCNQYGGCPFREICSKSPVVREQWLEMGFVRRRWDPLVARGDI